MPLKKIGINDTLFLSKVLHLGALGPCVCVYIYIGPGDYTFFFFLKIFRQNETRCIPLVSSPTIMRDNMLSLRIACFDLFQKQVQTRGNGLGCR